MIGNIINKESKYPAAITKITIPKKTILSTTNIIVGFATFEIKLFSSFIVTL